MGWLKGNSSCDFYFSMNMEIKELLQAKNVFQKFMFTIIVTPSGERQYTCWWSVCSIDWHYHRPRQCVHLHARHDAILWPWSHVSVYALLDQKIHDPRQTLVVGADFITGRKRIFTNLTHTGIVNISLRRQATMGDSTLAKNSLWDPSYLYGFPMLERKNEAKKSLEIFLASLMPEGTGEVGVCKILKERFWSYKRDLVWFRGKLQREWVWGDGYLWYRLWTASLIARQQDELNQGLRALGLEKVCGMFASMPDTITSDMRWAQTDGPLTWKQ